MVDPLRLHTEKPPQLFEARGEVYMTSTELARINKIQAEVRAHVSDYLRRAQGSVVPQSESASSPSSLQPAVQPRKA